MLAVIGAIPAESDDAPVVRHLVLHALAGRMLADRRGVVAGDEDLVRLVVTADERAAGRLPDVLVLGLGQVQPDGHFAPGLIGVGLGRVDA